jgi:hypothetical protein
VVVEQLRSLFRNPEALVKRYQELKTQPPGGFGQRDIGEALAALDRMWDQLSPGEQERIVQSLVKQVDIHPDRADVKVSAEGLTSLIIELRQPTGVREVAA